MVMTVEASCLVLLRPKKKKKIQHPHHRNQSTPSLEQLPYWINTVEFMIHQWPETDPLWEQGFMLLNLKITIM